MKLTCRIFTTISGLSEGIFWNFPKGELAQEILDLYEIPKHMLPEALNSSGDHGTLSEQAASKLGLAKGTPVSYRAGHQPNNALFPYTTLFRSMVLRTAYNDAVIPRVASSAAMVRTPAKPRDRKSTRLNSSHVAISYAVFCLKKKRLSEGI